MRGNSIRCSVDDLVLLPLLAYLSGPEVREKNIEIENSSRRRHGILISPYLASCHLRIFYNNLPPPRSQQSSSFLSSVSRFMMYQARLSSWIPKHRKTTVVERTIATTNEIGGSGKLSCQKQQTLFGFPTKNQTTIPKNFRT